LKGFDVQIVHFVTSDVDALVHPAESDTKREELAHLKDRLDAFMQVASSVSKHLELLREIEHRQRKCGEWGAGFIVYSREQLGCFGARGRGTCTNRLTIPRPEVEQRVLRALQDKLMRTDFFEEFCREFAREIDAIKAGYAGPELKAEMDDQVRKNALLAQLTAAYEPLPLLHPSMADLYRTKVEKLAAELQREDTRLEASEMLRGLIDSIVLTPDEGQLRIELRGNLAAMLTAAQQTNRSPETGDLLVPVQLVAGAQIDSQVVPFRAAIPKIVCSRSAA
jgi:hypothetical protein